MFKVKTSDNDGITLDIAKKNLNFILIGGISALLSLLDSLRIQNELYTKYTWYLSLLVVVIVYIMYIGIISLALIGIRNLLLPSEIRISSDSIELRSGLLRLTLNVQEFVVSLDETGKNVKIVNEYKVEKPAIIILHRNDSDLSIPIEAKELLKLNKIQ